MKHIGIGNRNRSACRCVRPWLHFQLSLCYFVIVQYKHSTLYVWSREGTLSFIVCMRCIFFGPYHSKLYLQLQLQSHLHSLCNFPANLLTTCIPWNRITLDPEPCYLLFWRAKHSMPYSLTLIFHWENQAESHWKFVNLMILLIRKCFTTFVDFHCPLPPMYETIVVQPLGFKYKEIPSN